MSFDIEFDYRFDEANFFTPERKAIIEQAGKIWSSYIRDEFAPIPKGETLRFPINNIERKVVLEKPIDDLLIFISSVNLASDQPTLGEGAYYATYVVGSDREQRIIGDDFEPWLGTVEFNASVADSFFFDPTPETDDDIPFNKQDFLSLSLHEIGHVLGIGIANQFSKQIQNGHFIGTQSIKLNGGHPIPLDADQIHIRDGFSVDPESDALMDKSFTFGERNLPTDLDLAILADIGYDIFAYDRKPVYRFFQYEKGFHFYTANKNERKNVILRSEVGEIKYNYENVGYEVLGRDTDALTGEKIDQALPVYRFFNRQTGAHLYTMDEVEKDHIIDNLRNYNFENIAYYAFKSQPQNIGTVPLYRMLNTQSNSHLFTADSNEFNVLEATQPHFQAEGNQGITFYVLEPI
ncbi:MAG: hypothetical protein ACFCU7_17250 [Pleurocapsa sp.]